MIKRKISKNSALETSHVQENIQYTKFD